MEWISLSPNIRYLPAQREPLSAEVVLLERKTGIWLFDTGAGEAVARQLTDLSPLKVIISHFHPDHMDNLKRLKTEALYLGRYTFGKTGWGTVIGQPVTPENGLTIFPLPSCHAKGSLGLLADNAYAFLGDGVYSTIRQSRPCYNSTLLKDTIDTLREVPAPWFAMSHSQPFLRKKEDVLAMLEQIYRQRQPDRPIIFLNSIKY